VVSMLPTQKTHSRSSFIRLCITLFSGFPGPCTLGQL
jgi:hypothetical protein